MSTGGSVVDTASDWLNAALSDTANHDDVVLTSPYVTINICKQIVNASRGSSGAWKLITSLDPSAVANGYLSVQGLLTLLEAGVEVHHVERLHAKCFIVGTRAMLGSANLTGAGLGSSTTPNRELGVELNARQVADARTSISAWPALPVSRADLDELTQKAKHLTSIGSEQYDELNSVSALQLAEKLLGDARDEARSLWVKLEHGEPALNGWRQESLFASPKKGRPGFTPGDLVFICAKDTHDCYAVVEVTSEPEFQPRDYLKLAATWEQDAADRWPWVNRTKPRLVPSSLMELKLAELGLSGQALRNGHARLQFDQFTAGVRALARLASN